MKKEEKFVKRILKIGILLKGEPIFSEMCNIISIEDMAAGEFVNLKQQSGHVDAGSQEVSFNTLEEWEAVKEGVDMMFEEIKRHEVNEEESRN